MRRAVGEVAHPDQVEGLGDPRRAGAAQPEVGRAEGHVVAHRRHEELVVGVLEDDADPAADLEEGVVGDRSPETVTVPAPGSGCR